MKLINANFITLKDTNIKIIKYINGYQYHVQHCYI